LFFLGFFSPNNGLSDSNGGAISVGGVTANPGAGKPEPPSVKKRQKRAKGGAKGEGGPDGGEFGDNN